MDNYKEWRGNNYFCCKGKCLVGPNGIKPIILTSALILVPYSFFLAFCAEVIYVFLNLM